MTTGQLATRTMRHSYSKCIVPYLDHKIKDLLGSQEAVVQSHASHTGSRQRDTVVLARNVSVNSRMATITIAPPTPMNGQTV
jgi:hypothetical protein